MGQVQCKFINWRFEISMIERFLFIVMKTYLSIFPFFSCPEI